MADNEQFQFEFDITVGEDQDEDNHVSDAESDEEGYLQQEEEKLKREYERIEDDQYDSDYDEEELIEERKVKRWNKRRRANTFQPFDDNTNSKELAERHRNEFFFFYNMITEGHNYNREILQIIASFIKIQFHILKTIRERISNNQPIIDLLQWLVQGVDPDAPPRAQIAPAYLLNALRENPRLFAYPLTIKKLIDLTRTTVTRSCEQLLNAITPGYTNEMLANPLTPSFNNLTYLYLECPQAVRYSQRTLLIIKHSLQLLEESNPRVIPQTSYALLNTLSDLTRFLNDLFQTYNLTSQLLPQLKIEIDKKLEDFIEVTEGNIVVEI